ncbi:MAG TPA: Mpo1-like protein [Candidatus Baltobacteraceae bacterium]|nr:Mpo1-like protein [Candidatus Baltobacteraceae bacterium]
MTKTELFTEYGSYHADRRNRVCHAFGIPLIVLGILGLAHLVRLGPVDLAVVAAVAVLVYYAAIDVRGALISLVVFAVLYLAAVRLAWQINLAAFILGWGFQFVGHKLEGTKPKFFENLVYLLIGPLYIFEEVLGSMVRPKRVT